MSAWLTLAAAGWLAAMGLTAARKGHPWTAVAMLTAGAVAMAAAVGVVG